MNEYLSTNETLTFTLNGQTIIPGQKQVAPTKLPTFEELQAAAIAEAATQTSNNDK